MNAFRDDIRQGLATYTTIIFNSDKTDDLWLLLRYRFVKAC